MSLNVNLINPNPITAWLISTATAGDCVVALNTIAALGWKGTITSAVQPNSGGAVVWDVTLTRSGYPTLKGTNNCWIVSDGEHVDIFTSQQFQAIYTADVEMQWAAIESPPFAQSVAGGGATVTFPVPTSPNGPFTFTVVATNTTTGNKSQLTDQAEINGIVTFTASDLVDGDEYTFVATAATPYGTTQSAVSNPITAAV